MDSLNDLSTQNALNTQKPNPTNSNPPPRYTLALQIAPTKTPI